MSNALCAIAAATAPSPGTSAAQEMSSFFLGVLGIGTCVLLVLVLRWAIHPGRLGLAGTPGRPNHLHPAHVVALFALGYGLMAVAGHWQDARWRLASLGGGQILWLAACLGVASVTFRFGLRRGLGLSTRHWILDGGRAVVACLAALPVCVALLLASTFLIQLLPAEKAEEWLTQHELFRVLPELPGLWYALPVLLAVVLAPLAEEVFFRGLLQSMLRRYLGPWPAVAVAAFLFGMVHSDVPQSVLPLMLLGAALGYNYERTGRLVAPILMHGLFNAVFFANQLLHAAG